MLNEDILKEILTQAADPDKAPEALLRLRDEATELFGKYDASIQEAKELAGKLAEVRDTNHRLFLKVTGSEGGNTESNHDEPETADEALKWLTEKIGGNDNA